MPFAHKIVLHTPISDETLLDDFVEECLIDGVSLIAVVGPDCRRIEDVIDELVVGDGSDSTRFIVTTAHSDETVEDVLDFVAMFEIGGGDLVQEVRL